MRAAGILWPCGTGVLSSRSDNRAVLPPQIATFSPCVLDLGRQKGKLMLHISPVNERLCSIYVVGCKELTMATSSYSLQNYCRTRSKMHGEKVAILRWQDASHYKSGATLSKPSWKKTAITIKLSPLLTFSGVIIAVLTEPYASVAPQELPSPCLYPRAPTSTVYPYCVGVPKTM